jgi:hypothetical protein
MTGDRTTSPPLHVETWSEPELHFSKSSFAPFALPLWGEAPTQFIREAFCPDPTAAFSAV